MSVNEITIFLLNMIGWFIELVFFNTKFYYKVFKSIKFQKKNFNEMNIFQFVMRFSSFVFLFFHYLKISFVFIDFGDYSSMISVSTRDERMPVFPVHG